VATSQETAAQHLSAKTLSSKGTTQSAGKRRGKVRERELTVKDFGGGLVLGDDVVGGEVEFLLPDLIVRHLQCHGTSTPKTIRNGEKIVQQRRKWDESIPEKAERDGGYSLLRSEAVTAEARRGVDAVAAARGERFGVRVWGAAGFGLGVVVTVEARRASGVQAASC
jgi:hypothetical protein